MASTVPGNFDWVTARHNCNVGNILQKFKVQARANVDKRNPQLPAGIAQFGVEEHGGEAFTVHQNARGGAAIDFAVEGAAITVKRRSTNGDGLLFSVTLTVDGEGRCRCAVAGELLDPWQVLMKALEPLFFG